MGFTFISEKTKEIFTKIHFLFIIIIHFLFKVHFIFYFSEKNSNINQFDLSI